MQQFAPFARANQGVVMVGGQGCEYCTCMLFDVVLRVPAVFCGVLPSTTAAPMIAKASLPTYPR